MKVITGGLLIDGTGREPIPGTSVVIDDGGRVTHAGKLDAFPADAEVIDVSGKTIMPGLIDCHVHFFVDIRPMQELALTPLSLRVIEAVRNARATLDAGITAVRDAGGTPMGFKLAAERGLIPAPRMRISVTMLSQTGGHGDGLLPSGINSPLLPEENVFEWPNGMCDGVDEVRKTVRAVLRAGADFIKLASTGGVASPGAGAKATQFTREEISVMVYEAKAQGKTCMSHAQGLEGIRNAVVCGVESIEHGFYVDESILAEMKKRGTFLVPTFQALMGDARNAEREPGSLLPQSIRKARECLAAQRASAPIAIESGVRIAMGTDAGCRPHGANAEELRLMVENGMTPMQSIVASTKTASECIHMDQDIGTLEPGKLADLLVVDGNPLENIGILEDKSKFLMIMQGGHAHKDMVTAG